MNFFDDYIICKNSFFNNPDKVLKLFDKQDFITASAFPGKRTNNLLESTDDETRNFALFFVQKLCNELFPGIHGLMIDVRFHINTAYDDDTANKGWIHCDDADLAGLVYMTPFECSLDTGTSIFFKTNNEEFSTTDFSSRQNFNLSGVPTDQYITDLTENHKCFVETIRVGNVYNRIIAYDARMFHRPNRYNLDSKQPRKSIVFFIRNYKRDYSSNINLNFNWDDK